MLKSKARILAAQIEYHWWMVTRYRRVMSFLYKLHNKLNSPVMLWLNGNLTRHALFIMKAERRYEEHFYPVVGGVLTRGMTCSLSLKNDCSR